MAGLKWAEIRAVTEVLMLVPGVVIVNDVNNGRKIVAMDSPLKIGSPKDKETKL